MEALDLAASLRMVGAGVLGLDPEMKELRLKRRVAVTVGGGVDAAVVGEQRGGQSPGAACLVEGRDESETLVAMTVA